MRRNPVQRFRRDALGFLSALQAEQGDVARAKLGRQPFFLVSHPELAAEVLIGRHRVFAGDNVVWTHRKKPPLPTPPGLLRSRDPDQHLRGRRYLQPAFRAQRLAGFAAGFRDLVSDETGRWREGELLDVQAAMRRLLLRMLGLAIFGDPLEERADTLGRDLRVLLSVPSPPIVSGLRAGERLRLVRSLRLYRSYGRVLRTLEEVRGARGARPGEDLPALLNRAEGELGLEARDLAWEAFLVLLAGYDTTATALTWCLYLLALHPAAEARVAAEAESPGEFTRAVVAEALRLYPPSWFVGRRALEPQELGGREIPAGASVWVSPWVIHRDARWYDEPTRFVPERWLAPSKRPRLAFMPFGAGSHRCLGEPLAHLELEAVLAGIAARRRLRLADDRPVRPVAAATLRPRQLLLRVGGR